MARCWYGYRPELGFPKSDPAGYRPVSRSIVGTSTCLTGAQICAIYAPGCGIVPDAPFSERMVVYINASMSSNVPIPSTFPQKIYLYKKS